MSELLRKLCWSLVLVVMASCGGGRTDDSELTSGTSKLMTSSSYGQPASAEAQAAAAAELKSYFAGDKTRVLKDASLTESASIDTKASASGFTPRAAYRFFNTATGVHFYTVSEEERQRVQSTLPQFQFEGTGFFAVTANQNDLSPVYRFYNRVSGTHFYTISLEERDHVAATWPTIYAYEGIAWYASKVAGPGWLPIYRFFNTQTGTHFYSATPVERDNVIANLPQFAYEGIGYYIRLSGNLDPALVGADSNSNGVRDSVEQVIGRLVPNAADMQANLSVARAYERVLTDPLPSIRDDALAVMGAIACAESVAGHQRIFEPSSFGLLPIIFDTDARINRWAEFVDVLSGGFSAMEVPGCPLERAFEKSDQLLIPDIKAGLSQHQDRPVRVLFVNGITNSIEDALKSSNSLATVLNPFADDFSFEFFYNPTQKILGDNLELHFQAGISSGEGNAIFSENTNRWLSTLNAAHERKYDYYEALGMAYRGLFPRQPGSALGDAAIKRIYDQTRRLASRIKQILQYFPAQKIVLVPHSQGNYYVESAMGWVLSEIRSGDWNVVSEQDLFRRVAVFGVAPVAGTTWNLSGQDYVRHTHDSAIKLHAINVSEAQPLPINLETWVWTEADGIPNEDWSYSGHVNAAGNSTVHGFLKVYLNSNLFLANSQTLPDFIAQGIRRLFAGVTSVTPSVAPLDRSTVFTVAGHHLPSTALMTMANAECGNPFNYVYGRYGEVSFQQTCTPRGTTGAKAVTVKTNNDANGGVVIDNSLSVDVMLARFRPVPGYSAEECILDTSTGLIWEGKTSSGLRSADNTYTMANYSNTVWGEYIPTINGLRLCGRATWGLPTLDQIVSLFSLDESELSVLSGVRDDYYWTITSPGNDGNYVYVANPLRNVYTVVNRHGPAYRVRLVSAQ